MVKNYANPNESFVYRGHSFNVSVAKFSPNGFWVASGDASGKVRVWSWDNPEHLMKIQVPALGSAVVDLDWDSESKKIVAAGEGSGVLVKCFTWDTGSAVGEMLGQNKRVQSVAYKPNRPFRIMSGGEDMRTIFYAGPPFKLDHSNATHTNFVNAVRYAPNGSKVASVGTDKKIQLYDGATGQPTGDVVNAHDGGIYGVAFSPDSANFVTASADKTLKVWAVEGIAHQSTLTPSADPQLGDAQVTVNWHKDSIISVSLNGTVNVFSPSQTSAPAYTIVAHQTGIGALALDLTNDAMYTGSLDGVVIARDLSGDNVGRKLVGSDKRNISRAMHNGKVSGLVVTGEYLVSVGWDDKIRWTNPVDNSLVADQSLNGQPSALVKSNTSNLIAVVTNQEIALFRGQEKVASHSLSTVSYTVTSVALQGEEELAVGASDNKTRIYSIVGGAFTEVAVIPSYTAVSAVSYNPTGDLLAVGSAGHLIEVYERGTWTNRTQGRWVFHTSKITALAWSPSGNMLASGSLDESVFVWTLGKSTSRLQIPFAHTGGVTGLQWASESKLVSAGSDAASIFWKIPQEEA